LLQAIDRKILLSEKKTFIPDCVHAARRLILTLSFPVGVTHILNADGVLQEHIFAAYVPGLLLLLYLCSVMFVLPLRFVRTGA